MPSICILNGLRNERNDTFIQWTHKEKGINENIKMHYSCRFKWYIKEKIQFVGVEYTCMFKFSFSNAYRGNSDYVFHLLQVL